MSKPQKIATISLWVLAVVSMMGVLALKSKQNDRQSAYGHGVLSGSDDTSGKTLPHMYVAPAFSLIDQDGRKVGNGDLRGHPWIADFVFTTCKTICPTMSEHMEALQKILPPEVKLVSFSVDPEHDTPAVMKKYLDGMHAQPGRWIMLTGDLKTQAAVVAGMKLEFEPAAADSPIVHDSRFVLVDGDGHIRGYYESTNPLDIDRLVHDTGEILGHPIGSK